MTVSAYRDHGGRTDWNCGGITYGGHSGTDFAIYGGWGAVDEGRDVVAVAEGTVVQAHDGEFDRCTTGGCSGGGGWGNYVAIQHADGVVTYYAHQRTGSIAVGVGDWVGCGQHLGFIASSGSSTGPHLHFEPRWGGPGTGIEPFGFGGCSDPESRWADQGPYASVPAASCPSTDRLPEGWLDEASCDHIYGWAIDPDDGAAANEVYISFDAPLFDPAATSGHRARADVFRLDVGNHGFDFPTPPQYRDGRDHSVWVYGLGLGTGGGALLSGSPRSFRCTATECVDRPHHYCLDATRIADCSSGAYSVGDCGAYGTTCDMDTGVGRCTPHLDAALVSSSFPGGMRVEVEVGREVSGCLTYRNVGSWGWDEATRLGTTMPRDRESEAAASDWLGPSRLARVESATAHAVEGRFCFSLRGATSPGEREERFSFVQEGRFWAADVGGVADDVNVLTVVTVPVGELVPAPVMSVDAGAPAADADVVDAPDAAADDEARPLDGGRISGTCSATPVGRGSPHLVLLALALVGLTRRRR